MHPDISNSMQTGLKRALLGLAAVLETFSFYTLTNARFAGQGLEPQFFRFSTKSDIISNLLYLFTLALLLRAFVKPLTMSLRRAVAISIVTAIVVWITLGVRNFETGEFPKITSIGYLCCRALLLALLVPRNEYDFSRLSGLIQVVRNMLFVLSAAVIVAFVFSFTYTETSDYEELKRYDADAAVVLGAAVWHERGEHPSPTLSERIKVGEDLIRQGTVPKLIVTGSNAPGEKPEAIIAKEAMVKDGIEEDRIVTETSSHNTLDQVLFLRNELVRHQNWRRFVIVSDQYHLARVIEMCKFNGIDAIGTPSNIRQTVFDLAYYRFRESVALLTYWVLGK